MKKYHSFVFNKGSNGGEQVSPTTTLDIDDYEKGGFITQEFELQSYSNSVTVNLHGALMTPELLRQLADELEKEIFNINREK